MHTPNTEPTDEIGRLYFDLKSGGYEPKLIKEELTVFHGTSEANAKIIVESQHILETSEKDGRLGRGAYFYENVPVPGPEMARAWAKYRRGYPSQAVVAAVIRSEGIWDLTLGGNRAYFQVVLDWYVATVRRVKPDRIADIRVPNVVKFILATCPERAQIQCVRWDGFRLDEINVKRQRGLVVREAKCIAKLWLYTE
ncbi:MAG: hypothetical protein WAO21_02350 [Verrucomicrobiia bacterium]